MGDLPDGDEADEALRQAFSTRVDRLRLNRGLSRKQLALRLGSRTAFGRWGKGRAWPRAQTLYRLSEALGVTLDFLVLGRGPQRPSGEVDPALLRLREVIEAMPRDLREALASALWGQPGIRKQEGGGRHGHGE
jgi:transcriptional regulator with XRE-family HTH domain